MKTLLTALIIATLPASALAQSPLAIGSVSVSSPTKVATLEKNDVKGEPWRMAWSPDQKQIYVQTIEGPFHQPKMVHHYIVDTSNGKVKDAKGEPEWFNSYWAVKSNKTSPDTPGFEIALATENRREQTTSVPRGGDLAKGGAVGGDVTGTSTGDAVAAANNTQTVTVHMMKLKGQTVGEFINSAIVPGLTFAWAPAGAQAIAYTQPKGGKLVLMNPEGKRQEVGDVKDAMLPMWSADAKKLAWLEKDGKKKFELKIADVR